MHEHNKSWHGSAANGTVLLMLVSLSMTGCDPVRTTRQTVRLNIMSNSDLSPISNISVKMKWSRDAAIEEFGEGNVSNKASWDNLPWHVGVSDATGTAVIDVVVVGLDGSRASGPAKSDWVSKKKFIVKLERTGREIEECTLLMNVGETADTTSYRIVVESIGQSVYID